MSNRISTAKARRIVESKLHPLQKSEFTVKKAVLALDWICFLWKFFQLFTTHINFLAYQYSILSKISFLSFFISHFVLRYP